MNTNKCIKQWAILALVLALGTSSVFAAEGAGEEWKRLNRKSVELDQTGSYDAAVNMAKQSLQLAEKNVGTDHPDVATSLNNLAELYRTQGHYAQAEPLYKRSLAILEKALGMEHPDIARNLNNLALLYETQGQ